MQTVTLFLHKNNLSYQCSNVVRNTLELLNMIGQDFD